jgi:hypothetical protein
VTTESTPTDPEDDTEIQECDCQYLTDDFPCWVCVKTGRRWDCTTNGIETLQACVT